MEDNVQKKNVLGYKVIMSKLPREDFNKLRKQCDIEEETINSFTRKAVMERIEKPLPNMLAGRNLFIYNKAKDNFRWSIVLDNEHRVDVEDDLPAEYVAQLLEALKMAVDERHTYIKKQSKDSVPVPRRFVRRGL